MFNLILIILMAFTPPQCSATTLAGHQCSRKAAEGLTTCKQHAKPRKEIVAVYTHECGADTKKGGKCKNKTSNQFCHLHTK